MIPPSVNSVRFNFVSSSYRPELYTASPLKKAFFYPSFYGVDTFRCGCAEHPKILPIPDSTVYSNILKDTTWSDEVLNPGVAMDSQGRIHILYRAHQPHMTARQSGWKNFSVIGHAYTQDGHHILKNSTKPILWPLDRFQYPDGFEDPRITRIGHTYYIVLNASNRDEIDQQKVILSNANGKTDSVGDIKGASIYLITTTDFKHFHHIGEIGPPCYDKNAFFHPEKILRDGKKCFMLYHRIFPDIQFVFAESIEDLKKPDFWETELLPAHVKKNTLMKPLFDWELQVAGGAPPLKTKAGWLMFYYARSKDHSYSTGVALLDLKDPTRVIARSPHPIIVPEKIFEVDDSIHPTLRPMPNGIVTTGSTIIDDKVFVYYGVEDKQVSVRSFKLSALLDYLCQFDAEGKVISH